MIKNKMFTGMESEQVQPTQQKEPSKKKLSSKEIFLIGVVILLLAALGAVGYLYNEERKKAENPTQLATEEAEKVKENVSKLMILPDEEPTIATIIDVDKLKEENAEFYKDAQNGDKLLIFSQKAIIYNPTDNIIVNVAPVIRQPEGEEVDTGDVTESGLTIELRNGSTDEEANDTYEDRITENLGEKYTVLTKSDASEEGSYIGIVVYDLSGGTKDDLVQSLVSELSATVKTALPEGESESEADVVVIIGK